MADWAADPHDAGPKRNALKQYEAFLVPALVLFLLGAGLAYALPGWPLSRAAVAAPAALVLIGLVIASDKPWVMRLSLWLMALMAGGLLYAGRHFEPGPQDVSRFAPLHQANIEAVVESQKPDRNQAVVRVTRIQGRSAEGLALFYEPPALKDKLQPGDRLQIRARLSLPHANPVPGTFDQRRYLHHQHISALIQKAETVQVQSDPALSLYHRLLRLTAGMRSRVAEQFRTVLPSPQAEVLGGLVLGDRAVPVDRDTKQAFVQTGLIHLLAASGMNVGIIAAAVFFLFSRLKAPYRLRLVAALLAVGFYSLLTGMPPSIQRAASMLGLALGLKLVRRELSPILLLCIAAAFLVGVNPDNIGSIGFQFSVLTTFGLIVMVPPLQERFEHPAWKWAAGLVLVPLVAQLWIWPLSVAYFNEMPLHAIPLNIAALGLVTPLTIIGFTAALASLVAPIAATPLLWLSQPLLSGLLGLVRFGEGLHWAQARAASPEPWLIAGLYMMLLTWLWLLVRPPEWRPALKATLALAPLLILLGVGLWRHDAELPLATLDVLPFSYQRQGYLLKPPGSQQYVALLPAGLSYWEGRGMADYLKHRNIAALDALILLPENQLPAGDEPPAPGLRVLAQKTAIRRQLSLGRDLPGSQTLKTGRLHLGELVMETATRPEPRLQLSLNGQCLLQLQGAGPSEKTCAFRQVSFPETRTLGPIPLESQRFYRLQGDGRRLALFGSDY